MKKIILALLVQLSFAQAFTNDLQYHVVRETEFVSISENLLQKSIVIQNGDDVRSKFDLQIIKNKHLANQAKSPIIVLPGNQMNFDSFMVGSNHYVDFLAAQGHTLYGLSPRSQRVKVLNKIKFAGSALDWGAERYAQDVLFVASQIIQKKSIIMGYSLGVLTGGMAINQAPESFLGFAALDGLVVSESQKVITAFSALCEDYKEKIKNKSFDLSQGLLFKFAGKGIQIPIVNKLIYKQFTSPVPDHIPGFTFLSGSKQGFNFTSDSRVSEIAKRFNSAEPVQILQDVACIVSGQKSIDLSGVRRFRGPVLNIGTELGFGSYKADNEKIFQNSQVTSYLIPQYGHADLLLAKDREQTIYTKLKSWLDLIEGR